MDRPAPPEGLLSLAATEFRPGQRVRHPDFGAGVVVEARAQGLVRVFFESGERQVRAASLQAALSWDERVLAAVGGEARRARRAWLSLEAWSLPLVENAAALTSARVDLLPHQVVLTHHVAEASPRRFLVADEVGLGKTIETALILRELASRGELTRALMVVPAGLVHNWQRELNEVFHLDFEVFGAEGDVTDRRSNAFARHHRLIASIDTLKRPARVRRILEAPPWDLVVFDEAHHLAAHRQGNRVRKTENYKLAEALRGHARDLLLLSATPHQGDHFAFWMIVQLLKSTLFRDPQDMLDNRHRLNEVVVRRTKADACRADGSPLFARRWVHTETFLMSPAEFAFYGRLREYLQEGFALARRQGGKGCSLGFVMAVFQKIAASSFAAVHRTLRRRLLLLTVNQAMEHDQALDIEARDALYAEARVMIREELGLGDDLVARTEVDRHLADLKLRVARRMQEEDGAGAPDEWRITTGSEVGAPASEEDAAGLVAWGFPEERRMIRELLAVFPPERETKVDKLLHALGVLWQHNPAEKVVVFATYLGTVDLLEREIEARYPGQGVVVLRGGDQGAKVAAERRFRRPDGPRVLVCTAAGREGINLQFSRILFNFDLPWNPMDLEQRIGRIHRYGQKDTAQVYNLVLGDTIEGRIFLLLEEKLAEIARTLGKVDERGNVAEDLRSQILGQLSERLSYERLYQEALDDPEMRRTRLEVEAALANASQARQVVSELFQDLDGFRLDDYQPFQNLDREMARILAFLEASEAEAGRQVKRVSESLCALGEEGLLFTTDRDLAAQREELSPLGLDHPLVAGTLARWADLPPEELGLAVRAEVEEPGVAAWWRVQVHSPGGESRRLVLGLACTLDGQRRPDWEPRRGVDWFSHPPAPPVLTPDQRLRLYHQHLEPMLLRELAHRGVSATMEDFTARLAAWVEFGQG